MSLFRLDENQEDARGIGGGAFRVRPVGIVFRTVSDADVARASLGEGVEGENRLLPGIMMQLHGAEARRRRGPDFVAEIVSRFRSVGDAGLVLNIVGAIPEFDVAALGKSADVQTGDVAFDRHVGNLLLESRAGRLGRDAQLCHVVRQRRHRRENVPLLAGLGLQSEKVADAFDFAFDLSAAVRLVLQALLFVRHDRRSRIEGVNELETFRIGNQSVETEGGPSGAAISRKMSSYS